MITHYKYVNNLIDEEAEILTHLILPQGLVLALLDDDGSVLYISRDNDGIDHRESYLEQALSYIMVLSDEAQELELYETMAIMTIKIITALKMVNSKSKAV